MIQSYEEAPKALESGKTLLGPGWACVDSFEDLDPEEYEDDEEEMYVTMDLGTTVNTRMLVGDTQYQLVGMDTPLPFLKVGNHVFQGEVTPLIGTEVILGLIRKEDDPQRPSHPPTHMTSHRLTFRGIDLIPSSEPLPPPESTRHHSSTTSFTATSKTRPQAKPRLLFNSRDRQSYSGGRKVLGKGKGKGKGKVGDDEGGDEDGEDEDEEEDVEGEVDEEEEEEDEDEEDEDENEDEDEDEGEEDEEEEEEEEDELDELDEDVADNKEEEGTGDIQMGDPEPVVEDELEPEPLTLDQPDQPGGDDLPNLLGSSTPLAGPSNSFDDSAGLAVKTKGGRPKGRTTRVTIPIRTMMDLYALQVNGVSDEIRLGLADDADDDVREAFTAARRGHAGQLTKLQQEGLLYGLPARGPGSRGGKAFRPGRVPASLFGAGVGGSRDVGEDEDGAEEEGEEAGGGLDWLDDPSNMVQVPTAWGKRAAVKAAQEQGQESGEVGYGSTDRLTSGRGRGGRGGGRGGARGRGRGGRASGGAEGLAGGLFGGDGDQEGEARASGSGSGL